MDNLLQKYNVLVYKISNFFATPVIQGLCFIMYKILVDLIYFLYIGNTKNYGIIVTPINVISSYICVILFSYFIYTYCKSYNISSLILIIINMIYFIPITTYCSLGLGSSTFFFYAIIFWLALSIMQLKIPIISLKRSESKILDKMYLLLFIGVAVFTLYIFAKYSGFRIITDLQEVYEVRAKAASYNFPIWFSYLQHFSSILIPLLILMSFSKKNYLLAILGCILLFINFCFAGHKSVLFMGILLVIGYLFWKKEMLSLLIPGGCLFGIFGVLEERLFHHAYIINYFFRRQGYVLAQLSDEYYRFFRKHPTDIFRSTFLEKLGFDSPYLLPLPKVIGNNFETQSVNCNNGLLADVWSHLGIIGLIIIPIIIIVCFRLLDMASDGLEMKYVVGLGLYYAVMFSNTTWSTVLLTHGFLLTCVIFFLFPRKKIA